MTHKNSSQQYLKQQLLLAEKARKWLEHSLKQCDTINLADLSMADFDKLESLSRLYGRFVDILINKLFRAVDQYELMEAGTLIDTLNRAEKRGIVSSKTGRELKELRNLIVHEHDVDVVSQSAADIMHYAEIAIKVYEKLLEYLAKSHKMELE